MCLSLARPWPEPCSLHQFMLSPQPPCRVGMITLSTLQMCSWGQRAAPIYPRPLRAGRLRVLTQISLSLVEGQGAGQRVIVQSLRRVRLFATPWTAPHQASLSFTLSQSLLKLMPIELAMPPNHLILCHPLSSCPPSFPASRCLPVSQLFGSRGQSIVASASPSVLPTNIQG